MKCILNGKIMPVEKAFIGIRDLALIRGYGIFDFFRLSAGVPLFMEDHLDRFYKGAADVRLQVPISRNKLEKLLAALFAKNNMPVSGVRLILTGGITTNGYDPGEPNLIITQEPITFPSEKQYTQGIKLITYNYLRDLPFVKTINYMTGIWLQDKIKKEGAYDVVYHNDGKVLELTRSNIFIVTKDDEIITPKDQVLWGVTRKQVIEKASQQFTVIQRAIGMDELYNAKEAFLTGTTKKVLAIRQLNDHVYHEPNLVTHQIMQLFKQGEEEYVSTHIAAG